MYICGVSYIVSVVLCFVIFSYVMSWELCYMVSVMLRYVLIYFVMLCCILFCCDCVLCYYVLFCYVMSSYLIFSYVMCVYTYTQWQLHCWKKTLQWTPEVPELVEQKPFPEPSKKCPLSQRGALNEAHLKNVAPRHWGGAASPVTRRFPRGSLKPSSKNSPMFIQCRGLCTFSETTKWPT